MNGAGYPCPLMTYLGVVLWGILNFLPWGLMVRCEIWDQWDLPGACGSMEKIYPLVMTNSLLLKITIYSGFTH